MSSVYLIRHAQAGTRLSYDTLSELGREQARLLGEYLVSQPLELQAVYTGGLKRQRQTADAVYEAFARAGRRLPDPIVETGWNEFDLDAVYADIAPALAEADPEFRSHYEELRRALDDENAPLQRTWSPCDVAIVRAWIAGTHPVRTESWPEFTTRICASLEKLCGRPPADAVAVFTSATPIAISVGRAVGCRNGAVMRMAGVMYNSAFSTLRIRGTEPTLFSFNNVPHLADPGLRTFR